MYYGHSLLRLHDPTELCTYVFTHIVIVWTSVYWHTCSSRLLHVPCLFHDVTVLSLKFSSTIYGVFSPSSLCRAIPRQLALWTLRYVVISVMNALCIPVIPVLFYSCPCTVVIPCALRGTLLRCPVVRVFYSP